MSHTRHSPLHRGATYLRVLLLPRVTHDTPNVQWKGHDPVSSGQLMQVQRALCGTQGKDVFVADQCLIFIQLCQYPVLLV